MSIYFVFLFLEKKIRKKNPAFFSIHSFRVWMILTSKDKALISILVIAVVLVVSAIITACVMTFNNAQNSEKDTFNLNGKMQKIPKCNLFPKAAPGVFATCENTLICEDPISEVARICYSEKHEIKRIGKESSQSY